MAARSHVMSPGGSGRERSACSRSRRRVSSLPNATMKAVESVAASASSHHPTYSSVSSASNASVNAMPSGVGCPTVSMAASVRATAVAIVWLPARTKCGASAHVKDPAKRGREGADLIEPSFGAGGADAARSEHRGTAQRIR